MSTLTDERRAAALKAAQEIIDQVKSEGRDYTDDELSEIEQHQADVEKIDAKADKDKRSKSVVDRVLKLRNADDEPGEDGEKKQGSLGEHFIAHAKDGLARLANRERLSISAPEFKAAGDVHMTPAQTTIESINVPQIDRTIVAPSRRRPFLADLLGSGTMTAPALTYFVQGIGPEGAFATVAEGATKPQLHYGPPTPVTDTLKKIAGFIKESDEMIEDFDFLVSEINSRALYDLSITEETQLLSGDGLGTNVLGLLNRSGIQTEAAATADDNADAIFRAMTKVQTATGLDPDGVVINPVDYQNLRLRRDANEQYMGGGFFQGQYGQGGVNWQLPVWGQRTVVTPGIAAGTVLVGAFAQAATVYRKGGVRVESTNSNEDDFINNRVTIRIEERIGLAVRRPAAVVEVTLSAL